MLSVPLYALVRTTPLVTLAANERQLQNPNPLRLSSAGHSRIGFAGVQGSSIFPFVVRDAVVRYQCSTVKAGRSPEEQVGCAIASTVTHKNYENGSTTS